MKNNINKKWFNALILIIVGICSLATAYYIGYTLNEKKNQEYIKKTYPSMKDLVRMKFEQDIRRAFTGNWIQILPDQSNQNVFYVMSINFSTPTLFDIYKIDTSGIPNYFDLDTSIPVYYPDKMKPIFTEAVDSKKSMMVLLGLDGDKLVFRTEENEYPRDIRECPDYANEIFNDFQYIDINGSYEQISQPYQKTPQFQELLKRNTINCNQKVEENYNKSKIYFETLEKKLNQ